MQALILAGGEGTRLRPLTSTIPKPVVPLANRPHMAFMIEWLGRHGVDEVILACGFMAEDVRRVLGDGGPLGVRIRYVEEPEPLGTGGALRYAGDLLDGRFLMLNGDVLSDFDVSAQFEQHKRAGARATLALYEVEDPSAYGLVRLNDDGSVSEFLEKPSGQESGANLINAGIYVLERSVVEEMAPPGANVSIEREVFPKLVGRGLHGFVSAGYWLDIGTPERYLEGNFDILEGRVETELGAQLEAEQGIGAEGAMVDGRVIAPALLGPGASVEPGAVVGGRAVLGSDVVVESGARVERSVVLDGARIGGQSTVRGSIIGPGGIVGEDCQLDGVVLGQGVKLGDRTALLEGERVAPGASLPATPVSS